LFSLSADLSLFAEERFGGVDVNKKILRFLHVSLFVFHFQAHCLYKSVVVKFVTLDNINEEFAVLIRCLQEQSTTNFV
jgi:hypothetical protein